MAAALLLGTFLIFPWLTVSTCRHFRILSPLIIVPPTSTQSFSGGGGFPLI